MDYLSGYIYFLEYDSFLIEKNCTGIEKSMYSIGCCMWFSLLAVAPLFKEKRWKELG